MATAYVLLWSLANLFYGQLPRVPQQRLVFTHVTIIDATATPTKRDMALVVIGDTITEIGPIKQVRLLRADHVVEAAGKFLIPGLWDMHAHIYPRADSVGFPHF